MYWADQIASDIVKTGQFRPYWVDDMKTPSGRIHVGSLRGVLIHDLVCKALKDRGESARFSYVYNDMDPMDDLPNYLDAEKYAREMGKPFYRIPAPDGTSANYAVQFADDFIKVCNQLGAYPEIIWSHDLYESGSMNQVIKDALDHAPEIRDIYRKIAKQRKPDNWYPFQVICPRCGKLGSTNVDGWDGEKVHFRCEPDLVQWAKGCGYEGVISPFNGTGKLVWKVDWPAHWKVIGITIEGAGKDHSSEGGSRDLAGEIVRDVYRYPEPYDIPYEWFLIGGRKMSSSKGVGTAAREFVEMMPPELGRFLFVKTKFNRQINFDPTGMTIPDLFDEYDRMAAEYWHGDKTDYSRIFELSQIGNVPPKHFLPRFRDVARTMQDPKIDMVMAFEREKGSQLNELEHKTLDERIRYAKIWLERYAPAESVFRVNAVATVTELSENQKQYLHKVAELLTGENLEPESFQQELYQMAKAFGIPPKDAFTAIYQVMLGKAHGPKAAWLLLQNKDQSRQLIDNAVTKR